ncbi:unnamed protein product [Bemisia tabaci]|uniref:Uncharacterized protein n=1 Tax=Bemisia tabaci TaxID=7038 RepID=A0A9P0A5K8_BEMTA|nr:unnamed protein product [Bemisia tabaci]
MEENSSVTNELLDLIGKEAFIIDGKGMKKFIDLLPIYNALGPLKASTLPGLHALSGADMTRFFAKKREARFFAQFKFLKNDKLYIAVKLSMPSLKHT